MKRIKDFCVKNKDFFILLFWFGFVTVGISLVAKGNWIPSFYYDNKEVKWATGQLLTSMKEIEILLPDKIIKFDTNKKEMNVEGRTNIDLQFDYTKENIEMIRDYYEKQAAKKDWLVITNTSQNIELEKDRGDHKIRLNFINDGNGVWNLNAYYLDKQDFN